MPGGSDATAAEKAAEYGASASALIAYPPHMQPLSQIIPALTLMQSESCWQDLSYVDRSKSMQAAPPSPAGARVLEEHAVRHPMSTQANPIGNPRRFIHSPIQLTPEITHPNHPSTPIQDQRACLNPPGFCPINRCVECAVAHFC